MIYLSGEELLTIARRAVGGPVVVRDPGLLESAAARPRTRLAGTDAYPDLIAKCAALLHSLARNRALADGNEQLALAAVIVFLGINGRRLVAPDDAACDLVLPIAAGTLDDVEEIAARLTDLVTDW